MSALRAFPPITTESFTKPRYVPDDHTATELHKPLQASIEGEVRFDAGSRAMYSVDSSNYRQVPIGVVVPSGLILKRVDAAKFAA